MASEKPASVKQGSEDAPNAEEEDYAKFAESLMSMENIDRSSPELWPEKCVNDFISNYTPVANAKAPYSREFTNEDNSYITQLASLSTASLISKVKELHDIAYQLGVEESKEMTRGKYLNIFKARNNRK